MPLTAEQTHIILITERASSILSLCGATLVVLTFILKSKFRKPINRLVFYATWGNVLSNVATLMSTAGIQAGQSSSICQIQAFLIQWFMPADALWTFAMACNVYLSFFKSYNSNALRKLEWKYFIACYGIPFFPACAYLFVQTQGRGKVYGAAVLWCWVSLKWELLRVATFYGPVWLIILTTFAIYIKVGAVVFRWRNHLMSLELYPLETIHTPVSSMGRKETEILVQKSYAVTRPGSDQATRGRIISQDIAPFSKSKENRRYRQKSYTTVQRSGGMDPNKATLKYCKCALLFFIALLITWVPSTINRIWTLIYPDPTNFGINFAAAIVLPLQGFWNAVVYFATSIYAVRSLWSDIRKSMGCGRSNCTTKPTTLSSGVEARNGHQESGANHDATRSSSQSELVRAFN